jgi:hypothetical protein
MERSSASVGSGIFRCRSVFAAEVPGMGGSILNGFPSAGGRGGDRSVGISAVTEPKGRRGRDQGLGSAMARN